MYVSLALKKRTNYSSTVSGRYINSAAHREMQQGPRYYSPQRQENSQKNIQENRSIFNQIRHIQAIGSKLITITRIPPTLDHIGDLVKIPFISNWYDSISSNYE